MSFDHPYLDLGASPREDDLLCLFDVTPAEGVSMEKACNALAAESSIGTWTDVGTLSPDLRERLKARVLSIDKSRVCVAYGACLFEPGNMAQIYSSVAGNIFGMKDVRRLRLAAISFPEALRDAFPGPGMGIRGIREALQIFDRPLVGTIVKPKIGLSPKEQAQVLYEAMASGCDVVKDDENLTSQAFCPFEERLRACLDATRRAEDATGQAKAYIPNVTAPTEVMLKRAGQVSHLGGKVAMVDLVTAGWSGVQSLRGVGFPLILHGHRAMHAAFTRLPDHGIAMAVLSRSARLAGIDQLHVGTAVGKMAGGRAEVLASIRALTSTGRDDAPDTVPQNWKGTAASMPIASGGLHPGHIPEVLAMFGRDVILQFGGGIHGHPGGTAAGAKAVRQALDASLAGLSLEEAAGSAPELRTALDAWKGGA
ncbi:MAG: type III ribulose-bisphosphate carboxylase [Acidobacteriota bacterium]